jgi:hypothetical protein
MSDVPSSVRVVSDASREADMRVPFSDTRALPLLEHVTFHVRWLRFRGRRAGMPDIDVPDIERREGATLGEHQRARAYVRSLVPGTEFVWGYVDAFLAEEEADRIEEERKLREIAAARFDWRPNELMPEDDYT